MKKNFIAIFAFAVFLSSCSKEREIKMQTSKFIITNESKDSTAQTVYAVSGAILEGNWAKLDTLLDKDFTYTGDGYVFTKNQYIGFMQNMRAAFSNFEMTLDNTVCQGDYAAIRFTSKAINTGSFMGSPANQKDLVINGSFQRRVKNGKAIQEWQSTDLLGLMNQIGFGAVAGYAVFVTGFNVAQDPIVRKPADFLHVNGDVKNYDVLSAKEKNAYIKNYIESMKK